MGIGRTLKPTRSGTGSFSRSHQTHASGQNLPLIRTLLQGLHHGLQARLRPCPVRLADGGFRMLRFEIGQQEGGVEIALHGSTATGQWCHRWDRGFFTYWPQAWQYCESLVGKGETSIRVPPVFATVRARCARNIPGARSPILRPYNFCQSLNDVFSILTVLPSVTI